jgi:hypothetical protein
MLTYFCYYMEMADGAAERKEEEGRRGWVCPSDILI